MADFIPKAHKGHIYFDGEDYFRVEGFSGKLNEKVNVIYVDKSGIETGEPPRSLSITAWNKMGLKDTSEVIDDKGGSDGITGSYTFSYDPDNGDIVITHPDGIKTDRIKGLKGKDGESVFDEWCKRKRIKNPTQSDWEDFMHSLRGETGQVVNGQDAPSPYEEWLGRQPKDAKPEDKSYTAFIRSITGPKGKDGYEGRDGLSAFEVWKSIQPNGDSLTEKDFFEFLKGETGKNGHEGVDGKDGDTWKPYVSEDGVLYFENTRTGKRTDPVNIKGLQGPGADKGANGDTWEPYFSDDGKHQLYFKNQKGEILGPFDVVGATGKTGPQGPRGESAYQIWLNEGYKGDFHDFLLWIAKQAQKGDNGKDGDTFRPHIEKGGHLFFISDKTGERIDIGWIKGDKGDQGETGLNGHNVTHKYGYKEIYDWTCPVQEINPHLIASSDDLASGGSAEKHMEETLNRINNLRNEGKRLTSEGPCVGKWKWFNKVLYFVKNPLKEFFWWCSGADRPLLRMCPAEHSKYMGIGTVIFFTALMAMVSSLFAISYVFGNHELAADHEKFTVCVIFAIFWGLMIFFLDRFITNTMYSDGKVTISWLELRSALPRILISIFLGIVISAPLELKIFDQEINEYIVKGEQSQWEKSAADPKNIDLHNYYVACDNDKKEYDNAVSALNRLKNLKGDEKCAAYPKYVQRKKSETTGQNVQQVVDKTTNKSNTYRTPTNTKEYENIAEIDTGLYNAAVNKADIVAANAKTKYENSLLALQTAQKEYINNIPANDSILANAGLYMRLAALHAIAFHEDRENKEGAYEQWSDDTKKERFWGFAIGIYILLVIVSLPFTKNVTKSSNEEESEEDSNNNNDSSESFWTLFWKGAAVLWPWFAVVALICGYCNNALFNALPYYIFSSVGMIMMLFILIDVSPVFYKMMLADGQYEQYLHKEKSITQDLVRLNFAKSIAKVNESEIGRLAPLIFSKPFKKIKKILRGAKGKSTLEWCEDEYGDSINIASKSIRESNTAVFELVLGMKKAIIEASYQAWYRDMRDAIIGMHKPGGPNGGNAPIDDTPNDSTDPSAHARRDTGHHTSEEEPFSEENYYGNTTGTSPDYDASSDDPHPETPEDFLNEEDSHLNNPSNDVEDTDSDEQDDDSSVGEPSQSSDDDNSEEDYEEDEESSDSLSSDDNIHPDADVESEVSDDDDDDDDTINPK